MGQKIVGVIIGQKIEKAFANEFNKLNNNGTPFTLTIVEIQQRVPEYSSGNGHSALRNQEKDGVSKGYLCDKYKVTKHRENNNNPNSRVISVTFSK